MLQRLLCRSHGLVNGRLYPLNCLLQGDLADNNLCQTITGFIEDHRVLWVGVQQVSLLAQFGDFGQERASASRAASESVW